MNEAEFIPAIDVNKPVNFDVPGQNDNDLLALTQHFRAKVIEKAMTNMNSKEDVSLALVAAASADKQVMDRRKLEVLNKAVDNEAEAQAFIGDVLDRITTNPFAIDSKVDVSRIVNDDADKLPDIELNKGALDVGISDLNYETFLLENNVDPESLNGSNDDDDEEK